MENRTLLDKVIAPNKQDKERIREIIKRIGNYAIMAVISLIALLVIPFISGGINGDFTSNFPKTAEGWIFFWIMRGISVLLNIFLLALFEIQAEDNCKDDESYIKAKELLHKNYKEYVSMPRSPFHYKGVVWLKKGTSMILTTIISSVAITALVLNFDIMTFIGAITSLITGLGFGYVSMRQAEIYWTEEYLEYAKFKTGGNNNGN